MINPLNCHILIEPIKHESFMFSERVTYDEVGIVIEWPDDFAPPVGFSGSKVFFDSWLAAKFPKGDGSDEYYWLVPYDSIKGYEPLPTE